MPDLCCCEYYDIDGERNHLLASCCNCYHLDETFERLITCRPIAGNLQHSLLQTLSDRMRIPWYGGAKQVHIGMPFLYVPGLILFATCNLTCTVIAGMIALIITWIASKSALMIPKFFVSWMIVSLLIIIGVFEILTVPWLLIQANENILTITLMVIMIACVAKMHIEVRRLREGISSEKISYYCQLCQIYRNSGTVHKYWIDTCVTSKCFKYYLIGTLCGSAGFLYVANLNLTTVCHPFTVLEGYSLLLPDDCGEVYASMAITLPFVTAVYATCIGTLLFGEFLVNFLGYTQCLGVGKIMRLVCSGCCYLLCCFNSGANTKPPNLV